MLNGNCAGLCAQSSCVSAECAWMQCDQERKDERERENERMNCYARL